MSTAKPGSTIDLSSIPRAVLSVAVSVVHGVGRAVVGDARMRTARGNAWEAICADRDRAHRRAEIRAQVAALVAAPPARPRPTTVPPDGRHGRAAVRPRAGEGTRTSSGGRRTAVRQPAGGRAARPVPDDGRAVRRQPVG
jgi:hypothetical protein